MVTLTNVHPAVARIFAASLAIVAAASTACGGSQETQPSTAQSESASTAADEHHRLPPPAAFEACKGKAIDDACTVQMSDREINGKCAAPPPGSAESAPACRPEHARHRGHHGPPPEKVFAACDGKAEGDQCSVELERGTVQGSCRSPKHLDAGTERLLCAPAHPHKREGGAAAPAGGK